MSTMPPISSFGSAPVMTLSSPAARTPSIQSRKSRLAISRPRRSLLQRRLRFGSVGSRASGARLFIGNDPSEDRLDRDQAWIFRLAHDGEQLEPELVVGALHKLANGAGDEIRGNHGRRRGAPLDSGGDIRIERRKHRRRHIRTIEIGNEITEHASDPGRGNSFSLKMPAGIAEIEPAAGFALMVIARAACPRPPAPLPRYPPDRRGSKRIVAGRAPRRRP